MSFPISLPYRTTRYGPALPSHLVMEGTVVVTVALMAFTVLLVTSIAMADMAGHMYVFAFIYYLVFAIISPDHYQKKLRPI